MQITNEEKIELVGMISEALNPKFEKIDERLDGMDKRLDGMDKRLDGMDKRLDGIDKRLDGVDKRFDEIDRRFDALDDYNAWEKMRWNQKLINSENLLLKEMDLIRQTANC